MYYFSALSKEIKQEKIEDILKEYKILKPFFINGFFGTTKLYKEKTRFASVIVDNFIYIFGGIDKNGNILYDVDRYNIQTNEWETINSLPTYARFDAVAVYKDGLIYIIGGETNNIYLNIIDIYSIEENKFINRIPIFSFNNFYIEKENNNILASCFIDNEEPFYFNIYSNIDMPNDIETPNFMNIELFYNFENENKNLYDEEKYNIITNTAKRVKDKHNNYGAYQFGEDKYIQFEKLDLSNSSFTISLWLLVDEIKNKNYILGSSNSPIRRNKNIIIGWFTENIFTIGFYENNIYINLPQQKKKWVNLTITHNHNNLESRLYVNGILIGNGFHTSNYEGYIDLIGKSVDSFFKGKIDDILICKKEFSEDEVYKYYNNTKTNYRIIDYRCSGDEIFDYYENFIDGFEERWDINLIHYISYKLENGNFIATSCWRGGYGGSTKFGANGTGCQHRAKYSLPENYAIDYSIRQMERASWSFHWANGQICVAVIDENNNHIKQAAVSEDNKHLIANSFIDNHTTNIGKRYLDTFREQYITLEKRNNKYRIYDINNNIIINEQTYENKLGNSIGICAGGSENYYSYPWMGHNKISFIRVRKPFELPEYKIENEENGLWEFGNINFQKRKQIKFINKKLIRKTDNLTITASSTHPNVSVNKLINDNPNDGWANNSELPCWIMFEFNNPIKLDGYEIIKSTYYNNGEYWSSELYSIKTWKFEGSHDGNNWVVLDEHIDELVSSNDTTKVCVINNDTAYKYYRLYIIENNEEYTDFVSLNKIYPLIYENNEECIEIYEPITIPIPKNRINIKDKNITFVYNNTPLEYYEDNIFYWLKLNFLKFNDEHLYIYYNPIIEEVNNNIFDDNILTYIDFSTSFYNKKETNYLVEHPQGVKYDIINFVPCIKFNTKNVGIIELPTNRIPFSITVTFNTNQITASSDNDYSHPTLLGITSRNSASQDFAIEIKNGFLHIFSGLGTEIYHTTNYFVADNLWHIVTVTFDKNKLFIYADNNLLETIDHNWVSSLTTKYQFLGIGKLINDSWGTEDKSGFNGYIKEIIIHEKGFNENEIDILHNNLFIKENYILPTVNDKLFMSSLPFKYRYYTDFSTNEGRNGYYRESDGYYTSFNFNNNDLNLYQSWVYTCVVRNNTLPLKRPFKIFFKMKHLTNPTNAYIEFINKENNHTYTFRLYDNYTRIEKNGQPISKNGKGLNHINDLLLICEFQEDKIFFEISGDINDRIEAYDNEYTDFYLRIGSRESGFSIDKIYITEVYNNNITSTCYEIISPYKINEEYGTYNINGLTYTKKETYKLYPYIVYNDYYELEGTPIEENTYPTSSALYAFDEDLSTGWVNNNKLPSSIGWQFNSPINLKGYGFKRSVEQGEIWKYDKYSPKSWVFEASNDGNEWIILHEVNNQLIPCDEKFYYYFVDDNNEDYIFYRVKFTETNSNETDWITITEMVFLIFQETNENFLFKIKNDIKKYDSLYIDLKSKQNIKLPNILLQDNKIFFINGIVYKNNNFIEAKILNTNTLSFEPAYFKNITTTNLNFIKCNNKYYFTENLLYEIDFANKKKIPLISLPQKGKYNGVNIGNKLYLKSQKLSNNFIIYDTLNNNITNDDKYLPTSTENDTILKDNTDTIFLLDDKNKITDTIYSYNPIYHDNYKLYNVLPLTLKNNHVIKHNDKLLIIGGIVNNINSYVIYEFNLLLHNLHILSSLPQNIINFSTSYCYNKYIYIIGGLDNTNNIIGNITKYDISKNTYKNLSYIPNGLANHSSIYYNNKIYIIGGKDNNNNFNNYIKYYDLINDAIGNIENITTEDLLNPKIINFEDNILIIGGTNNNGIVNKITKYNITNNTIEDISTLPLDIKNFNIIKYLENYIFLFGGEDENGNLNDKVYIYDYLHNQWYERNNFIKIKNHGLYIEKNNIYIIGGENNNTTFNEIFEYQIDNTNFIYNISKLN